MATILELGQKVKAKYPGQYDDLSDQELGQRVKTKYPTEYADFEDVAQAPQAAPSAPTQVPVASPMAAALRMGPGALVAPLMEAAAAHPAAAGGLAGGVLGGALGGPAGAAMGGVRGAAMAQGAAAAGAGVLGTLGAGIKELTDPSSEVPTERIKKVLGEGGMQTALELGGGLTAQGAKLAARVPMVAAMGRYGRGGLQAAGTALQEGVSTTRGGLKRLMGRIGKSGEVTMNLAKEAARNPRNWINARQLTAATQGLIQEAGDKVQTGLIRREVQKLNQQFWRDHGVKPLTPDKILKLRQNLNEMAAPIWKAIEKNEPVSAVDQVKAKWAKALGDQANVFLKNIPDLGEQIAKSDARTASLIRVKEAIAPTVRSARSIAVRGVPSAAGATIGASVGGSPEERIRNAAVGAAAGSPAMLSQIALLAHSPGLAAVLAQLPRFIATGSDTTGQ